MTIVSDGIKEERDRLFQRTMHEDNILNERLSFFMVFESLLLAGLATLYASEHRPPLDTFIDIAWFGVIVSLIWIFALHRQLRLLNAAILELEAIAPEVVRVRIRARGETDRWPKIGFFLAYVIPGLVTAIWAYIVVAGLISLH